MSGKSSKLPGTVQARILDASRKRFTRFGYGKTTMAEIAKDCRMSAANLYRFFESKQDIGAGLACRCMAEDEAGLKDAVSRPGLTAAQRLELFVLETLRHTYDQWSRLPKLDELIQMVSSERSDLMHAHQIAKRHMLMGLLAEGNASGEFDIEDLAGTADAILLAINIFDMPFSMHLYSEAVWQTMARNVAQLIFRGVRKC